MADSLTLKGATDVSSQSGNELSKLNPKGGGDVFKLKRWWINGGVNTAYVNATVFQVKGSSGTVNLALQTNRGTAVCIKHDGSFGFDFIKPSNISRAALFTDKFDLIEHYVFPSISGGKVMTVIPCGSAVRP